MSSSLCRRRLPYPAVYDNFNDPANDGGYNKGLWEIVDSSIAANVSQQNGVIALTVDTAG